VSERAIVLVADDNFLPHAKSLMVNCRRQGKFDGDFCLIHPAGVDVGDMERRGIVTMPAPADGFLAKFWVFSSWLQRWQQVFYLDCDIVVQDDIQRAFDQLTASEALPDGTKPIIADIEDGPAIDTWRRMDPQAATPEHEALYAELIRRYPGVPQKFWNTAFLLFEPASIPAGTVERLVNCQLEFSVTNLPANGGTDQQIIHAVLFNRFREKREKLFCFWGLDEPENRGPSAGRGFVGGEHPVAVHFCRWYAQWIPKTPDMAAYRSERLGVVLREFYLRNLADFEAVFPVRP
jgi:hypothetical protein